MKGSNGVDAPHTSTSDGRRWNKGQRIIGAERQQVATELVARYRDGASIRGLALRYGRSYGFVHRVLTEAGVALRGRGGARHRPTTNKRARAPEETRKA